MKHVLRAALIVSMFAMLSGAAALAQDEGVPWTFVEAGYLNVDPEHATDGGDNWFAGASFGFLKNFHAFGRYVDGEATTNVDLSYWRVGAGWHGLLGEKADLVGEVAWQGEELDGQYNADGYRLTGGVRWRPIKLFEADGFVNYDDLSSDDLASLDDSQETYELRALVYIWRISIGAAYEYADTSEQYNVFARFNFGGK